jgi:hypothetical protein
MIDLTASPSVRFLMIGNLIKFILEHIDNVNCIAVNTVNNL